MITKEEITNGNRLIAEFMGFYCSTIYDKEGNEVGWRYHESWDWLMPVVEKIEYSLPDDNVITISYKACDIDYHQEGISFLGRGDSKIEATYKAVVEFILWHNKIAMVS